MSPTQAIERIREGLDLEVTDVSGQRRKKVRDVPADATVGELAQGLIHELDLPQNGGGGEALSYQVFSEREARHLGNGETVRESLRRGDVIVLQPSIMAGGCR